jgi:hypothetical protein
MGTNHKADSFDGGRAASLVTEPEQRISKHLPGARGTLRPRSEPDVDDADVLALAFLSLEADNDKQG